MGIVDVKRHFSTFNFCGWVVSVSENGSDGLYAKSSFSCDLEGDVHTNSLPCTLHVLNDFYFVSLLAKYLVVLHLLWGQ